MKLRQRCDLAVELIEDFDDKTDVEMHTDTGEVWRLLDVVKDLIKPQPHDGYTEPLCWAVAMIVIVLVVMVLA